MLRYKCDVAVHLCCVSPVAKTLATLGCANQATKVAARVQNPFDTMALSKLVAVAVTFIFSYTPGLRSSVFL